MTDKQLSSSNISTLIHGTGESLEKSRDGSDSSAIKLVSTSFDSWLLGFEAQIGLWLFPDLPESYSLRKKLLVTKTTTDGWAIYDSIQIAFTLLYVVFFLCFSYQRDLEYTVIQNVYRADIAITQVFILDFLLFYYMHPSTTFSYLTNGNTLISLTSMIPTYLGLINREDNNVLSNVLVTMNFLRCLRVLLILKITKSMRYVNNLSGLRRQVVYLTLSVSIMIILATGLVYLTENTVEGCRYINAATNWEPSCSEYEQASDGDCNCELYECGPYYSYGDKYGKPSSLTCQRMSRIDSFYYIIVTVATIGYGDVKVTSPYARAVVIIFIAISVVLIPMRLSELQNILSLSSPYSRPFVRQANEGHVIITGFTSDKRKLESFLSEFFHPDRTAQEAEEYHAVILSPNQPTEDIRSLLQSHSLESKVTWVLGSPNSISSLKKVQAETALGMFFLIDSDLVEGQTRSEDAANVLAALSVSNYNSAILSFVQVIRPENGEILQDSDVDMILCLDEYKTAIQARNTICPGFTTFIENIFHSMGALDADVEKSMAPWCRNEYLPGAGMEIYFVKLTQGFLRVMRYNYLRIVDLVYIKWKCTVIGLCGDERTEAIFNPTAKDVRAYSSVKALFMSLDTLIIMADDQHITEDIQMSLENESKWFEYISEAADEESKFPVGSGQDRSLHKLREYLDSPGASLMRMSSGGISFKSSSSSKDLSAYLDDGSVESDDSKSIAKFTKKRKKEPQDSRYSPSSPAIAPDENLSDSEATSKSEFTDEELDDDDDEDEEQDTEYVGYTSQRQTSNFTVERFSTNSLQSKNQTFDDIRHSMKASTKEYDSDNEHELENNGKGAEEDESDSYRSDSDEVQDDFQDSALENSPHIDFLKTAGETKQGRPSKIIKDAMNLSDHIIVHGGENQILIFIEELRKPAINNDIYHPIVIVFDRIPRPWAHIAEHYNDVYLLVGKITSASVLKRLNLRLAFSLSLMAQRSTMTRVDEINVNIGTLFTYLKLERYIPRTLHATVELTSPSNMGVLNATIMRRFEDFLQKQISPMVSELKLDPSSRTILSPSRKHPKPSAELVLSSQSLGEGGGTPASNANNLTTRRTVVLNQSHLHQQTYSQQGNQKKQTAKPQRRAAITEGNGRFATKRNTILLQERLAGSTVGSTAPPAYTNSLHFTSRSDDTKSAPTRRASTFNVVTDAMVSFADEMKNVEVIGNMLDTLNASDWDAMETHYVLPVFASSKAYVPSSFESLIVQSFYEKLTPIICDRLVCGQKLQSTRSIPVPSTMVDKDYIDLFRLLTANSVLCIGIYRQPQKNLGAVLPYTITNPEPDLKLGAGDLAIVFADSTSLLRFKIASRQVR